MRIPIVVAVTGLALAAGLVATGTASAADSHDCTDARAAVVGGQVRLDTGVADQNGKHDVLVKLRGELDKLNADLAAAIKVDNDAHATVDSAATVAVKAAVAAKQAQVDVAAKTVVDVDAGVVKLRVDLGALLDTRRKACPEPTTATATAAPTATTAPLPTALPVPVATPAPVRVIEIPTKIDTGRA